MKALSSLMSSILEKFISAALHSFAVVLRLQKGFLAVYVHLSLLKGQATPKNSSNSFI